jgi:hypothetical protein
MSGDQVVSPANGRCDQENLPTQIKGGVLATTSVNDWRYSIMASLAWPLMAWAAPLVPEMPRHAWVHQREKQSV